MDTKDTSSNFELQSDEDQFWYSINSNPDYDSLLKYKYLYPQGKYINEVQSKINELSNGKLILVNKSLDSLPNIIGWTCATLFAFGSLLDGGKVNPFTFGKMGAFGMLIGYTLGSIIQYFMSNKSKQYAAHFKLGLEKKLNQKYYEAIQQFEIAISLQENHPELYFNLACINSLIENEERVIYYLKMAAKHRFQNLQKKIITDPDLAYFRNLPIFKEQIVNGYIL
jgi:hypothetical protein